MRTVPAILILVGLVSGSAAANAPNCPPNTFYFRNSDRIAVRFGHVDNGYRILVRTQASGDKPAGAWKAFPEYKWPGGGAGQTGHVIQISGAFGREDARYDLKIGAWNTGGVANNPYDIRFELGTVADSGAFVPTSPEIRCSDGLPGETWYDNDFVVEMGDVS